MLFFNSHGKNIFGWKKLYKKEKRNFFSPTKLSLYIKKKILSILGGNIDDLLKNWYLMKIVFLMEVTYSVKIVINKSTI